MFREEKKPISKATTINLLVAHGGIGDLLCSLPAINNLINTQYWINPLIWVPDYMLEFTKHFFPNAIVRDYSEAKKKFNEKLIGVSTKWLPQRTAMRTHPVDYAYQCLLDKIPYDPHERSYLKIDVSKIPIEKFELPNNYVVICATFAEKVKTMPTDTMNRIIDYCKEKGYNIVFIGQEKIDNGIRIREIPVTPVDFSKGLNLINKTTILELAAVMSGAKCVIGMDGGPIHIAGFTDVPIVAGYTFASPVHLMPIRDGIAGKNVFPVVPTVACRFCQTNWPLMYTHDFRKCYYGPEDFTCVKQMSFDKFKEQLDKVL